MPYRSATRCSSLNYLLMEISSKSLSISLKKFITSTFNPITVNKEKKLFSVLTFQYSFVLGLLAVLSLAGYFMLKENTRAERDSARIVNTSGRQRMLSQRAALYSLMLVNAKEKGLRELLRQELKNIIGLMERAHSGLLSGPGRMNLAGNPSLKIQAIYFSSPIFLDKQIRQYLLEAGNLVLASDNELNPENTHLKYILRVSAGGLIQSLDAVVGQYQKESELRIANLESLQFLILLITLLVLLLTGIFLFRPMARRILEDITNYKLTQEQLALSERLAAIGRMAGVIAHEFRNQLGVMRNVAYFLKIKIDTKDEKILRHIEILDEQITETERIIENILTFARSKEPKVQRVDLDELLKASLDKVKIPEAIKVTTHIETLPLLTIDPLQLGGIFVNIILNAIQAMGQRGVLNIEGTKSDNYVTIIFRDSGEGIKDEDKKIIFEPFFSTKPRGTGLGLSTAKIIIEKHGGSINLESEYGNGAAVIIRLPIGADA